MDLLGVTEISLERTQKASVGEVRLVSMAPDTFSLGFLFLGLAPSNML